MSETRLPYRSRTRLEELERQILAPYGYPSSRTRGRKHPEPEARYRTPFQRDRDRILHTTAFRRLEYKTQVFVNYEGDYYRTRLTHTLEVAQISRTLARALGANPDLAEAIAFAHDLGHPPFGHAGEEALHELMADFGGFDHNLQGLRLLEYLERRYPDFPGLNLTWEVREGVAKHFTIYDNPGYVDPEYEPELRPTLEAQIVNMADELAYNAHDLDDGLRAGLITVDQARALSLWPLITEGVEDPTSELGRHQLIRNLIGWEVTSVLEETGRRLTQARIGDPEEVRRHPEVLVRMAPDDEAMFTELKQFLYENLYMHPHLVRMSAKAHRIVRRLFKAYREEPRQLPKEVQARIGRDGSLERVICDYIAGMTDRFALQEYQKLFDPYTRV